MGLQLKKDASGAVVWHKVLLVAKGYVQRAGIDFDEVFALVARIESVRLLLALAAHRGWEVHHMDVKSAFLNGVLKEEVYVSQPAGFVVDGAEHKLLRLRKALYGLKQVPRAWNAKFDASMVSLGFQRSSSEHGVYTRTRGVSRLIVGVYIDDLVITGHGSEEILAFKGEIKSIFKMSDLGLPGSHSAREPMRGKLLERSGMHGCNPAAAPMEPRLKLGKESSTPEVNDTEYRRVI